MVLQVRHVDRQNVRLAAQLLSNGTATATRELFEEDAAAEVCATIDTGFDVLNLRCLIADKPLRSAIGAGDQKRALGAGEHWEDQKRALEKLANLMLTSRFGGKSDLLLPCQKGMVVSTESALSLLI